MCKHCSTNLTETYFDEMGSITIFDVPLLAIFQEVIPPTSNNVYK